MKLSKEPFVDEDSDDQDRPQPMDADGYLWDHTIEAGRNQLTLLESLFDGPTIAFVETVGVRRGWRCLDVGAGGGSITRWLAARTGDAGTVVAVDRTLDHLRVPPHVEVYQRDIHDGLPMGRAFDLVHARLLLANLPRRDEIFKSMVDALSPGGWLVLGEGALRPQTVLSSPSSAEEELFHRVMGAAFEVAGASYSYTWADEVGEQMTGIGLVDVDSSEYGYTATGGLPGCLLHSAYVQQLEQGILDKGISRNEVEHFHALMHDPQFRVWGHIRMVFTRGRRPA